jgi:hypothetical protein
MYRIVSGVYLRGHFFRYRSLLPIGWRTEQIVCQRQEITNTVQHQPLLVQYKQHANPFLSMHNYTPLVIIRNDKNEQSH